MSIVYRVEHLDSGKGPYNHLGDEHEINCTYSDEEYDAFYDLQAKLETEHYDDPDHPGLHKTGCISGCNSVEYLYWWFDGFIDQMRDLGFVLKVYNMKRVEKKDNTGQVVFRPKNATLLETRPL